MTISFCLVWVGIYFPLGLCGFLVIPKLKSGLFFFEKVLYELVFGSGNEDSHGNYLKNNASVLRAAQGAERRQTVLLRPKSS